MLSELLRGASYLLRGARFVLAHPRLWPLVAAPFVITSLVFALAIVFAFARFDDLVGAVLVLPSGWIGRTLWGVLYTLLAVSVGLAAYFSFFAFAALLAGPFHELLSESVEELVTGRAPPPFSFRRLGREVLQTIAHETRKILIYLSTIAILFLLSLLLPGPGSLLYLVGGFFVAARFSAYDALDATLARKGWSWEKKQDFLRRHRARSLGLGVSVAALMGIPLLNALALPFGCVGGTLLFIEAQGGSGLRPRAGERGAG